MDFFQNNKLITHKYADYLLFCDVFNFLEQKKHITKDGLIEILEKKKEQ